MLSEYGHLFIFLIAGLSFGVVNLTLALLVRFKRTNLRQQIPYECGVEPVGSPYVPTDVRFYVFALLFVLFDVEVLYIYPWAVVCRELGWQGFVAMTSFMAVLILALGYAWKRGGLDWART